MPGLTPSQTVGPFYWGTVVSAYRADLAPLGVAGERIEVVLTLHDVDGKVVADGLLELWQANSHGRYNHPEDRRNLPLDGLRRLRPRLDRRRGLCALRHGEAGPRAVARAGAACRRRTSTSRSSRAASSIAWRPGSISTAIRRWRRIRC